MNWQMSGRWRDELIAGDVARVRKEARYVIEIGPSGTIEWHNPDYGLNIIAVIGPTSAFGKNYDRAVLCEIGIGKTRPYRDAKRPLAALIKAGDNPITKTITHRRKFFSLSSEQYQQVASAIFFLMSVLTAESVRSWRVKDFFIRRKEYHYFIRQKKLLVDEQNACLTKRGCRFYVDPCDSFLADDLYLAELNSPGIRNHLAGLANFTDKFLGGYKRNGYMRRFGDLKRVKQLKRILNEKVELSLAPYLLPEFLKFLRGGKRNLLYADLAELVAEILKNQTEFSQIKKARSALKNNSAMERFEGIDLRLISEIPAKRKKTTGDFLCVEVFDKKQTPPPP